MLLLVSVFAASFSMADDTNLDDAELLRRYELSKPARFKQPTAEQSYKCAQTWLLARMIHADGVDESFHPDFHIDNILWLEQHWTVTTIVMTIEMAGPEKTNMMSKADKEFDEWPTPTRFGWAGLCYVEEENRVPYIPELFSE